MPRTIDPLVIAELAKPGFRMVSLLKQYFTPAVTVTDADTPVVWDGETYAPDDSFIRAGSVSETADLRVGTTSFTFGAASPVYPGLYLNNPYIDRQVRYSKALLDDQGQIIGEPIIFFDGRISGVKMPDNGGEPTVELECASHWANFEATNGRFTNSTSQKAIFPDDLGLDYAAKTIDQIEWGQR